MCVCKVSVFQIVQCVCARVCVCVFVSVCMSSLYACMYSYVYACMYTCVHNIYMFLGPSIMTLSGSQIKVCIFYITGSISSMQDLCLTHDQMV